MTLQEAMAALGFWAMPCIVFALFAWLIYEFVFAHSNWLWWLECWAHAQRTRIEKKEKP